MWNIIGIFGIKFILEICKQQNITRSVCSSCLKGRKGFQRLVIYATFFATKNCTASRLKARSSFLYPFAMCLLNFWTRINELYLILGDKSDSLTLLAESLRSFLDKSGKRKRLCRHLQVPLICRSSSFLDESEKF